MSTEKENGWLTALTRQSGIRRALIVHGNVNDVCYSEGTQDYRPVVDVLLQRLKARGFDEVVLWDRFSGVKNVRREVQAEMEAQASRGEASPDRPEGQEYELEGGGQAPEPQGCSAPDPVSFMAVVYHQLTHPRNRRYAFVLDYSHYLFGSANSLSEQERQYLLILSKAVRNAPTRLDAQNIGKPEGLLILVCNKLEGIPASFFQANPLVQDIVIPVPGRVEREAFLKRTPDLWLLRKNPKPGDADLNDFVDCLDGFTLRDLQQLIKLSRQGNGEPLSFEKLVNLYRYGEKTSPWEDLNPAKLRGIEDALRGSVKGQDHAIRMVRNVVVRAFSGLSGIQHSRKQKTPKGVLFFVGPTGVGKTELAKALARFLFGDEDACHRFDMSEFNHEHSDQRLVGAPPGYVGYEEGGQLTNAIKRRPFAVLLFDEIEKAHNRILDKFLHILEDGRLTDGKGETVYFSETVIIFTSNIGAAEIGPDEDPERVRERFVNRVRKHFVAGLRRPELLNRIGDNIVPFNFINGEDFLVEIARTKLVLLSERLREKYRIEDLVFDDERKALGAILRGFNRANGGRGVLNQLVKRLVDPLASFILEEEENPACYAGRRIRVVQAGDTPNFAFVLE